MDTTPIKILVVEDSEPQRLAITRYIESAEIPTEVIPAADVREALAVTADNVPDVAFIDQYLPDKKGIDLIRAMKKCGDDTYFILMTAFGTEEVTREAILQNVDDFINKGEEKALLAAIDFALDRYQKHREKQKIEEALRKAHDELERRVEERTVDLSEANARLEGEITERKRAERELEQSFEKLRRILDETADALASALEMRDPYTSGHQRRVAQLACAIAREMDLSEEQTSGIRLAALLHDIGKIHVPAEVLSKPGRLNETEFSLIKTHPQVGYEILKSIEFPWPIADIVLQHHEQLDGSGYPQGLSGEDVSLEGRILSVADIVEAMSSHRPYRPARGIDKALEEISKSRGALYDPKVVDACLRVFTEKGFKFE